LYNIVPSIIFDTGVGGKCNCTVVQTSATCLQMYKRCADLICNTSVRNRQLFMLSRVLGTIACLCQCRPLDRHGASSHIQTQDIITSGACCCHLPLLFLKLLCLLLDILLCLHSFKCDTAVTPTRTLQRLRKNLVTIGEYMSRIFTWRSSVCCFRKRELRCSRAVVTSRKFVVALDDITS